MIMENKVFTVKEMAAYLKVSTKTAIVLLREKKIQANKVGREWRILRSEVDRYLMGE